MLDYRNTIYFIVKEKKTGSWWSTEIYASLSPLVGLVSFHLFRYKATSDARVRTSEPSARYLKCTKAKENKGQLIYSEGIRWDKDLWKGTEGCEFSSFILQLLLIWVIKRVPRLNEAQNRNFSGCCGPDLQCVGRPPVIEMACRYWRSGVECVCGRIWVLGTMSCNLASPSRGVVRLVEVCTGLWGCTSGWDCGSWAQLSARRMHDTGTQSWAADVSGAMVLTLMDAAWNLMSNST